ncbi:MAG TPA: hypothetical protein VGM53_07005 [Streptosporangiaceae bacterium]|jgi:hypothetical protein
MNDQRDFEGQRLPRVGTSGGYHIQNSPGVVIGDRSSAYVYAPGRSSQYDAVELLDNFIAALAQYHAVIDDPAAITESAELARTELERPSPRWHAVQSLLKGIAAGVTGVSALTDLISKILALIPR